MLNSTKNMMRPAQDPKHLFDQLSIAISGGAAFVFWAHDVTPLWCFEFKTWRRYGVWG
jgi:hypothetical protein